MGKRDMTRGLSSYQQRSGSGNTHACVLEAMTSLPRHGFA